VNGIKSPIHFYYGLKVVDCARLHGPCSSVADTSNYIILCNQWRKSVDMCWCCYKDSVYNASVYKCVSEVRKLIRKRSCTSIGNCNGFRNLRT